MIHKERFCDSCKEKITRQLVINDDLWLKINKGEKKGILCPSCMEKRNKAEFKYQDLKKNSIDGLLPCNLWYCKLHFNKKEYLLDLHKTLKGPLRYKTQMWEAIEEEGGI